jgi:hypothetical protein
VALYPATSESENSFNQLNKQTEPWLSVMPLDRKKQRVPCCLPNAAPWRGRDLYHKRALPCAARSNDCPLLSKRCIPTFWKWHERQAQSIVIGCDNHLIFCVRVRLLIFWLGTDLCGISC